MTNKELLKKIHNDNKEINKNLQRLLDIGLFGLFNKMLRDAKEENDETIMLLSKFGLLLIAIREILLLICDITDFKKNREEDEIQDSEEQ